MINSKKGYEFDLQTIQTEFYINKVNSLDYSTLKVRYADLVADWHVGDDRRKYTYEFEQVQLIGENVSFVAKTLIYWVDSCNIYEKYDFKKRILSPFCNEFQGEIKRMYSYSLA